jgi:Asp-tRNA(Asn)/Glu-tRNA(Gln) amidotransferase A subunit family amidase
VTREAFAELVQALGEGVSEVELGAGYARAVEMHRTIIEVEVAHNLQRDYEKGGDRLSMVLRELIERGRGHAAVDYAAAIAHIPSLNADLDAVFDEYDAIVTPAAPGEAPVGLASTGDPIFCTLWTYLGTPAVTLPLLRSTAGMPLGVQLVGRRDGDARLLRTARWLVERLSSAGRRRDPMGPSAGRAGSPRARKCHDSSLVSSASPLVVFLGILIWWIKALPLTIIVVGVVLLLVYDFVQTLRYGENGAGR